MPRQTWVRDLSLAARCDYEMGYIAQGEYYSQCATYEYAGRLEREGRKQQADEIRRQRKAEREEAS